MPRMMLLRVFALFVLLATAIYFMSQSQLPSDQITVDGAPVPGVWIEDFPKTDFTQHGIPLEEIRSGGPRRDVIPPIEEPRFVPAAEIGALRDAEPVLGLSINGEAKAYPLKILLWHEIVNDTLGGVPITVTFCPLINAGIVYDRRVDGQVLDFGSTGRLRLSDMVMYDRQTETWWQQFTGEGIIGALTGTTLKALPVRLEGYGLFKARHPDGKVLVPSETGARKYGQNPYEGYDTMKLPPVYDGPLDERIVPMARVVVVDGQAWPLETVRKAGRFEVDDLVMTWTPGQWSAVDAPTLSASRDVGTAVVQRRQPDGSLADTVYEVAFAFAFKAFYPDGVLHMPPSAE